MHATDRRLKRWPIQATACDSALQGTRDKAKALNRARSKCFGITTHKAGPSDRAPQMQARATIGINVAIEGAIIALVCDSGGIGYEIARQGCCQ